MDKPILFLLAPGFNDRGRPEFCPETAELWGVLSYFPAIKEAMDIHYVDIGHPRDEMVALIGEANQNSPTLVFPKRAALPRGPKYKTANGHVFLDRALDISMYFAYKYSTPFPRGYQYDIG